MTKDRYFEMCELMGNEPIESEIPVEFDDFPLEVQQALMVYRMLRDEWEGFNGMYLGKSYAGLTEIFEYSQVEVCDRSFILSVIKLIDTTRSAELNKRQEQQKPAS
jgi:hypothetical protein